MRKYILAAIPLVLVLAFVLGHVYLAPGGDPPDDGLAAPDQALLGYFEPDYERSRAEFRRLATGLDDAYRGVERGAIPVPARDAGGDAAGDLNQAPGPDRQRCVPMVFEYGTLATTRELWPEILGRFATL